MTENQLFILQTLKAANAPVKSVVLIQILEISGKEFQRACWHLFDGGYIEMEKRNGITWYEIADDGRAMLRWNEK